MKKTLILSLLIVGFMNYVLGQQYPIINYGVYPKSVMLKNDTIRVVMLISDTSKITLQPSLIMGPDYLLGNPNWIYGYEVYKLIPLHWEVGDIQVNEHLELQKYLDDKKKPLSKNIIVWQTKEIK